MLTRPSFKKSLIVEQFQGNYLKAGVNMKARFWLVIMALTQISRLRFKQSRIPKLISQIYVLGRFVIFLVILGIFGDKQFSQRISKIYGNKNFEDLMLF